MSLGITKRQSMGGVRAPAPQQNGTMLDRAQALFGFDPADQLQLLREAQGETSRLRDKEARIASELATYKARFDYPSHWEHERKMKLTTLKEARRAEFVRAGQKITESALDDYAHAHLEYQNFLAMGLKERQKMESLQAELVAVRGEIEIAKGAETYFDRCCRMAESLIFHSAKETTLGS